jgi:hypothetical protein
MTEAESNEIVDSNKAIIEKAVTPISLSPAKGIYQYSGP